MSEDACQFGELRQLCGVVVEPEGRRRAVACILVTAGLVPSFGPYGVYTSVARQLAAEGFVVLRFDLGGIGESRQAFTGLPLKERTHREILSATQFLVERYNCVGVVVGGICSGAEDAFRFADRAVNVCGVFMIDPFSYRTRGWWWRHVCHQVAKVLLWVAGRYRPLPATGLPSVDGSAVDYRYMDHAESSQIFRSLLSRQVRVNVFYTSGVRKTFNHVGQFSSMFPGVNMRELVTVDYFPMLEHTQKLEVDRRKLVAAVARRLRDTYRLQSETGIKGGASPSSDLDSGVEV